MSLTDRASMPISSRREGRRGTFTSRARPSRTRCAAIAIRRSGRTMVRARNSDSRTESKVATPSAIASAPRWLRTVRVKLRSLAVTSRVDPPESGAAAEKTGVRSGAWRTSTTGLPVERASRDLAPFAGDDRLAAR